MNQELSRRLRECVGWPGPDYRETEGFFSKPAKNRKMGRLETCAEFRRPSPGMKKRPAASAAGAIRTIDYAPTFTLCSGECQAGSEGAAHFFDALSRSAVPLQAGADQVDADDHAPGGKGGISDERAADVHVGQAGGEQDGGAEAGEKAEPADRPRLEARAAEEVERPEGEGRRGREYAEPRQRLVRLPGEEEDVAAGERRAMGRKRRHDEAVGGPCPDVGD